MATRQTGFALLSEGTVQEVMDLSAVAHLAAIESSIPFLNFFDGFQTSHQIQTVQTLTEKELYPLINQKALAYFRNRGLNPNHPIVSGSNQNPDIHFQQRETINSYYDAIPMIVKHYMNCVNKIRGTKYDLVNYYGASDADRVIVAMGAVSSTIEETIDYLQTKGEKVGYVNVRLYRPFPTKDFLSCLPNTVKRIAVLDRTKEPGSSGEPLLLDVKSAIFHWDYRPMVIGGRYGLGNKNVTPTDIASLYHHISLPNGEIKKEFTIGIVDDVTHLSLPNGKQVNTTPCTTYESKFFGFGSDGTVSGTKTLAHIIRGHTNKYVQGCFEYSSQKSGGLTISHLRCGPQPIRANYLIETADFIGCHHQSYVHQYELEKHLKENGIFLLNINKTDTQLAYYLPNKLKKAFVEKHIRFFTINANKLAEDVGLPSLINMVIASVFLKISGLVSFHDTNQLIENEVIARYRKKDKELVGKNIHLIHEASKHLHEVSVTNEWLELTGGEKGEQNNFYPTFIPKVQRLIQQQKGDTLSVGDLMRQGMIDGSLKVGTTAYDKRSIAYQVPQWISESCTLCNRCSFVCPHAAIRPFLANQLELDKAPANYLTRELKGRKRFRYRMQVSIEDCTGCGLCVEECPKKETALVMQPIESQEPEKENWQFSLTLEEKETSFSKKTVFGSQLQKPLMEFPSACGGCGEAIYVKLLTKLFGERMVIANATGCSSIWGASCPSTPYTTNRNGQGPAWANSLLENNAEFGYGMQIAVRLQREKVVKNVEKALKSSNISLSLKDSLQHWLKYRDNSEQTKERADNLIAALQKERHKVSVLNELYHQRDYFMKFSQWIIGGDGWAYDIGYSGVDHVLSSGEDVNLLVLDNEVYSNTGGQASKATPTSSVAKFSTEGKCSSKKDLGAIALTLGNVYVAQISYGANPKQTLKVFEEAEKFPGPSLVIAYTPCINHGLIGGMSQSATEAKEAVEVGYWAI